MATNILNHPVEKFGQIMDRLMIILHESASGIRKLPAESLKTSLLSLKRIFDHHEKLYDGIKAFFALDVTPCTEIIPLSIYASYIMQGHVLSMRNKEKWDMYGNTFCILYHECCGLISMKFSNVAVAMKYVLGRNLENLITDAVKHYVIVAVYENDHIGYCLLSFDCDKKIIQCFINSSMVSEGIFRDHIKSLETVECEKLALAEWIPNFLGPEKGFAHFKCTFDLQSMPEREHFLMSQLEKAALLCQRKKLTNWSCEQRFSPI